MLATTGKYRQPASHTPYFCVGDKVVPIHGGAVIIYHGSQVPHGTWLPPSVYRTGTTWGERPPYQMYGVAFTVKRTCFIFCFVVDVGGRETIEPDCA